MQPVAPSLAAPDEDLLGRAQGYFNATLRDRARLGVILANDGRHPATGTQVLPRHDLREATDAARQRSAFGQLIFVDPQLKLVMAQTAATATPAPTSLAREANALWRGVIGLCGGRW